jgi:hypothetical protein
MKIPCIQYIKKTNFLRVCIFGSSKKYRWTIYNYPID